MSERIDFVKAGNRTTKLTLAVRLVDAFTGSRPGAGVEVSAAGVDTTPVENPSGYHLFLDLPDDPITVVVDGGNRYLPHTETIDPTSHDPPAVDIDLLPSPAYRFPPGATLLRGVVLGADDAPVADATASIEHTNKETVTDEHGEFVLFFSKVTADDVERVSDGRRLIRVDDEDPVLEVSHPDAGSTSMARPVEEKATTKYSINL